MEQLGIGMEARLERVTSWSTRQRQPLEASDVTPNMQEIIWEDSLTGGTYEEMES